MNSPQYRYECDNDLIHDQAQTTTVRPVDPATTELLDLLALPHRNGQARLSQQEWDRVEAVQAWAADQRTHQTHA